MFRMALMALFFAVLGVTTSCTSVQPITAIKNTETQETVTQRQLLIGTWWRGACHRRWDTYLTTYRYADGTFKVDFISAGVRGVSTTQSEYGIWGISGGIYFTVTQGFIYSDGSKEADMTNPVLYDTYRVFSLNDKNSCI